MRTLCFLLLVACKSTPDPNAEVCAHYAKLAVQCSAESSDDKAVLGDTADNLCKKGMSGKHEQMFGAKYKAMIECTRTATACPEYDKCIAGD